MEYIDRLNELHAHPVRYNEITDNCTTSVRAQRPAALRAPFDWRLLINGFGDQMLYEHHALAGDPGLDFTIETGLEHGGYVPRGRKAEDGRIDERYNLVELSTSSYTARTRRNIEESNGHLDFQP